MISVKDLSIAAGGFGLAGVDFDVPTGQYAVLMGKTGCGKTTLLEALCGLRTTTGGSIHFGQRRVDQLPPAERGIGYVPQDRALFQTMSVRDNLAFALTIRKWPAPATAARVEELAELLGVRSLLDRKPAYLSGGEAQRVALGRAIAAHPQVLMLDEPLSALDDDTRLEMYDLLESVQRYSQATILHVTHHQQDAHRLADVLLTLADGHLTSTPVLSPRPLGEG